MSSADGAAPRRPERYRADIEGLRALAVVFVVAYHAGLPGVRGGFVGVDVFFVLSGYLITGLLVEEVERLGRIDLRGFYARRVRRLLPGAALMLLVTLVGCVLLLAPSQLVGIARSATATSLYASNLYFMGREGNYFAEGSESLPLLHTWSLAVEEQFYFVWPVLLLLTVSVLRSRPKVAALLGVVTGLSFFGCLYLTKSHATWAFYSSPARAWEFAFGGLGWLLPMHLVGTRARQVMGWLGLLVLAGTVMLLSRYVPFPGSAALLPVVGTLLPLLAGAGRSDHQPTRLLGAPILRWLGRHSYSWYLWHWPALVFARTVFPRIGVGGRLAAVIVALGVAALAYSLVENPVRFNRRLVERPALSLWLALVLTLVTASGSFALMQWAQRARSSPELQRFALATRDRASLYSAGCVVAASDPVLRTCAYGDTTSSTAVVLIGDSHAVQWFPALEALALERHWKLITMVKVSCPAVDVQVYNTSLERVEPECDAWRKAAMDRVLATRPARIFMASYSGYPLMADLDGERSPSTMAAWRDGTRRSVGVLTSAGLPVTIFRDTPGMATGVPTCLARVALHSFYPDHACDARRADAMDEQLNSAIREATRDIPLASHVDLTDRFCDSTWCPAARGDTVLYFDKNHVTASFARTLAPEIGRTLTP